MLGLVQMAATKNQAYILLAERRGKSIVAKLGVIFFLEKRDLNFEVIGLLVFSFGHVNRKELKGDIFLEESDHNPCHGGGEGRAVHFHRRRHCAVENLMQCVFNCEPFGLCMPLCLERDACAPPPHLYYIIYYSFNFTFLLSLNIYKIFHNILTKK